MEVEDAHLMSTDLQKIHLLRGWCFKQLKSYSKAIESFNVTIENAIHPFPAYLQKIHTAYIRNQFKSYKRFLIKLIAECSSMKKFLKNLSRTLRDFPYFEQEWVELLNIISRYGKKLMPYSKTDIQGFQSYRSSSFMSMHFSRVRCAEFE